MCLLESTHDHPSKWPLRVLKRPFRAALSPVADKGTGPTAMAAPPPPAHAGERTVRVLAVALTVPSCARRVTACLVGFCERSECPSVSTPSTECEYSGPPFFVTPCQHLENSTRVP